MTHSLYHPVVALLTFLLMGSCLSGQSKINKQTEEAIATGKLLYRCEMASWHGTDLLMARYAELKDQVGGYFSYPDGESTHCVFFSDTDDPEILITFSFDNRLSSEQATVSKDRRKMSSLESKLYSYRKKSIELIGDDTLFKVYDNTSLNLIPLVEGSAGKVYVVTGPQKSGVVIIGNDYLIEFDKKGEISSRKRLHNNIIVLEYGDTSTTTNVNSYHSHSALTGETITPTDVCTLILYCSNAGWNSHYVISQNFVTTWICETTQFYVLDKKVWKNLGK